MATAAVKVCARRSSRSRAELEEWRERQEGDSAGTLAQVFIITTQDTSVRFKLESRHLSESSFQNTSCSAEWRGEVEWGGVEGLVGGGGSHSGSSFSFLECLICLKFHLPLLIHRCARSTHAHRRMLYGGIKRTRVYAQMHGCTQSVMDDIHQ